MDGQVRQELKIRKRWEKDYIGSYLRNRNGRQSLLPFPA
jgi:hypothetical protein